MGLKTDILKALEKNLTQIEIVDGKSKTVSPPIKEFSKLEILATDLSLAIQTFILAQDFKVDKLSAPVHIPTLSATPIAPIPAVGPPGAPLIQLLTPMKLQGESPGIPLIDSTADVDINGQAANGSLLGKSASDNSLVKLRSVKTDTG